jgi:hypothetical protein
VLPIFSLHIVKTGEEDFGKEKKKLGLPFSEEGTIRRWGFDGAWRTWPSIYYYEFLTRST